MGRSDRVVSLVISTAESAHQQINSSRAADTYRDMAESHYHFIYSSLTL